MDRNTTCCTYSVLYGQHGRPTQKVSGIPESIARPLYEDWRGERFRPTQLGRSQQKQAVSGSRRARVKCGVGA